MTKSSERALKAFTLRRTTATTTTTAMMTTNVNNFHIASRNGDNKNNYWQ
jgi:hypothetical protein